MTGYIARQSGLLTGFVLLACFVLSSGLCLADGDEQFFTVTSENVYVRSGSSEFFYPIGKVHAGDVVVATGTKYDYTSVRLAGPCFDSFFGHLSFNTTRPGVVDMVDSTRVRVQSTVEVRAPNLLRNYEPVDDWQPMVEIEPGRELVVVEPPILHQGWTILRVKYPEEAVGWISTRFLLPASPQEILAWKQDTGVLPLAVPEADLPVIASIPEEEPVEPTETVTEIPSAGTTDTSTTDTQVETTGTGDVDVVSDVEVEFITPSVTDGEALDPASGAENADGNTEADTWEPSSTEVNDPSESRELVPGPPGVLWDDSDSEGNGAPDIVTDNDDTGVEADDSSSGSLSPQEMFEGLEAAFRALQENMSNEVQSLETAEIRPLRQMYQKLLGHPDCARTTRRFSSIRIDQLDLWSRAQDQHRSVGNLVERLTLLNEDVRAEQYRQESSDRYVASGRLVASHIFNGTQLPHLFRIQEDGTGRTIAYIRPGSEFDYAGMLGQQIGIVGKNGYDGILGLNIVVPGRIDLLGARSSLGTR